MNPEEIATRLQDLVNRGVIKNKEQAASWLKSQLNPERPGLLARFGGSAGASLFEMAADIGERFVGNTPTVREMRRTGQLGRETMPRAQTFGEGVADFAGSAAPDIAAIVGTSAAITAATGGLGTAPSVIANAPRAARVLQGVNRVMTGASGAGRLGQVAARTAAGTVAASPLIAASAMSEESQRSPSRALTRYAELRRQMDQANLDFIQDSPDAGLTERYVLNPAKRGLDRTARALGEATARNNETAGGRAAFDFGLDLALGGAAEAALMGGGAAARRGLSMATDAATGALGRRLGFDDIAEGALEAGARGARQAMRTEEPRMPSAFDPFVQRDARGNPFFGDEPFVMPGENEATRQRTAGQVLEDAMASPEQAAGQAVRRRRPTAEGEASRNRQQELEQAAMAARQRLLDLERQAAQEENAAQREATRLAADMHREELRRAALRQAGEEPEPVRPTHAVTTAQQQALEALRRRDPNWREAFRAMDDARLNSALIGAGLGGAAAMSEDEDTQAALAAAGIFGLPAMSGASAKNLMSRMGRSLYGAHNSRLQPLRNLFERGERELIAPSTGVVRPDAPFTGYSQAGRPTQLILNRDFTEGRDTYTGDIFSAVNGNLLPYLDGPTLEQSTTIRHPLTNDILPLTNENLLMVKTMLNGPDPRGMLIGRGIDLAGTRGIAGASLREGTPHAHGYLPMQALEALGANRLTPDQFRQHIDRLRGTRAVANANARGNEELDFAMSGLGATMDRLSVEQPEALGPLAQRYFDATRLFPEGNVTGRFETDPVSVMAGRGWLEANDRSILDPSRFSARDFIDQSDDIVSPAASGRARDALERWANVLATVSNRNQAAPVNYLEQVGDDVLRLDRDVAGVVMPRSALGNETGDRVAREFADMNVPVGLYDDANLNASRDNFKTGVAQMLQELANTGRQAALPAAALAAGEMASDGEADDPLSVAMGALGITGLRGRQLSAKALQRLGAGKASSGLTTQLTMAIERLPKSWSNPRPLADWANLSGKGFNKTEVSEYVVPFVQQNGGKATAEEVLGHLRSEGVQAQVRRTNTDTQALNPQWRPFYKGQQGIGERFSDTPRYGEDILTAPTDILNQERTGHFGNLQDITRNRMLGWSRWWDEAMPDGNSVRIIGESQSDFSQAIAQKGIRTPMTPESKERAIRELPAIQLKAEKAREAANRQYDLINTLDEQFERSQPTAHTIRTTMSNNVPQGMDPDMFRDGYSRSAADSVRVENAVRGILVGLGGKREQKLASQLMRLMKSGSDVSMDIGGSVRRLMQEHGTELMQAPDTQTALEILARLVREEVESDLRWSWIQRPEVFIRDALNAAKRTMLLEGNSSALATRSVNELVSEIHLAVQDEITDFATKAASRVLQTMEPFVQSRRNLQSLADARSAAYAERNRLYSESQKAQEEYMARRMDIMSNTHNSGSTVLGASGMFDETRDTTFAATSNSILQAIKDGVQRIALDTPANRAAKANLPLAAAETQYGVNLPSAVNSIHRALGLTAQWTEHVGQDGITRKAFEITPQLREAIQRFGAPILTAAAMALEEDEAHGNYARAGMDLLDLMLIGGGAVMAGRTRLGQRLLSMGVSDEAAKASDRQLIELAERIAKEQAAESGWARATERELRNRARIQNFTAPYPEDAADPVRDVDSLMEYATKIIDDAGGTAEMREEVQRMAAEGNITAQGRIPIAFEEELATMLSTGVQNLATRDPARKLSGTELLALGKIYARDARRKAIAYNASKDMRLSEPERRFAARLAEILDDRQVAAFQRLTRDRSQTGRDLRLLKQAWKESDDPTQWLIRARKLAGGRTLSPDVEQEIMGALSRQDFVRAQLAVAKTRRTTVFDKAGELFQTNLLASLSRPLRDLFGNSAQAIDRAAQYKLASYYDRMFVSMFGGERVLGDTRTIRTMIKAGKRGAQQAVALLRGGAASEAQQEALERAAKRYDFLNETQFESPMFRAYAKVVRRMTAAADQPFYEIAFAMAIESQAAARAEASGLKGKKLLEHIDSLANNPTPHMLAVARDEALEAVWQNTTALGTAAMALGQRSSQNPAARLIGRLAIPFAQTPSAITSEGIARTPIGTGLSVGTDLAKMVRGELATNDARRRILRKLAAGTTGAGFIWAGYELADDGKMTGEFPRMDQNERAQFEQEQRIPNAVKLGGKWVGLSGLLGPQAILMAIGAEMRDLVEGDMNSIIANVAGTAKGAAQALLDSPAMQGMDSIIRVLTEADAEAVDRFAASYMGGAVPRVVGQAAQAMDELDGRSVSRDIRGTDERGRMASAFMANIPGLREELPAKVGVFGETLTGGPAGLAGILSPVRTTVDRSDPLTTALGDIGWFPKVPSEREGGLDRQTIMAMRAAEGPEERALLEGILAEDQRIMAEFVTDDAWQDYQETGDLATLLSRAVARLRSMRTQERRGRE